jgi:hypothetical protein
VEVHVEDTDNDAANMDQDVVPDVVADSKDNDTDRDSDAVEKRIHVLYAASAWDGLEMDNVALLHALHEDGE